MPVPFSCRPVLRALLDAVLPPRCLKCGNVVDSGGAVCPECWLGLSFLIPPACACCAQPFDFDPGPGALCGACTSRRPAFETARAVLRYDDGSRDLVLAFKHADRTALAPTFASWMKRAGEELIAGCDVIAPVPLHWSRLFTRRFNQAALLANAVATLSGKAVACDLLQRRRQTPRQGYLGRLARQRNVAGAFVVNPRHAGGIAGRRVLLIDDVITTGATVTACAKSLLQAGVCGVDVLALARVVQST